MRKCWLIAILLLVVGCSKDIDFEPSQEPAQNRILSGIIADEKDEDNESRVYLDNKIRIRWNKGDLISVFDGTTRNKEFAFLGSDGSSAGDFRDNSAGTIGTGKAIDRIYGLYPYASSTEYCYGEDESESDYLRYTLPATQTYKPSSMGLNANLMVAATANKSDKDLVFRNVCSYLRLKLYGAGQTVSSIVFKGNTDEVLSGDVAITATYGNAPTIKMLGAAEEDNKTITLDCSEGVTVGRTSDEATEFWLVVPPLNFPNGFTITVKGEDNMGQEIVINNNLTFARNTYNTITREVSMEELSTTTIPDNEIWYTATAKVVPNKVDTYYWPSYYYIESNEWDETTGKGVIRFGDKVTSIGGHAFSDHSEIKSITLPNTITYIGDYAFEDCSNLKSITIPENVTNIGIRAFKDCIRLEQFNGKFASADGNSLIVNGVLNSFAPVGVTEYTIPESVTEIGVWVFTSYSNLTKITIPNSVTKIGDGAFAYCSGLSSLTIPNSVTEIGNEAFWSCTKLDGIYINDPTPPTVGENMLSYNMANVKIYVPADYIDVYLTSSCWQDYADHLVAYDFETGEVVPISFNTISYTATEKVTPYKTDVFGANIVSNTYENGKGVIKFDGPVTSIGHNAFYFCNSLTEITLPNSVTSIGNYAFTYCSSLTEITIPDGVTSIGEGAFCVCNSLTSITIPNSVTSIGEGAFNGCQSLTEITLPNSVTSIGEGAFNGCSNLQKFYGKFAEDNGRCLINGGVLIAYANASGAEYTIPNSVTGIGDEAFSYCYGLTSITIPNSVTSIGNSAFAYCNSLTEITIPNSVTSIGGWAFSNCESLTEITIPNSVTSIGNFAFYWCNRLTEVTIGNGVTSIGDYTFEHCSSLTKITIPNSVTSIGDEAFAECSSLTEITIPNSVTSIEGYAFSNCSSLTEITIPNSVTSIGYAAFGDCSSLQNIFCKRTTPPTGRSYMFDGIHSSAKIYVPAGSGEAYKTAQYWSDYADIIVEEESEPDDTWKIYYTATAKVEPYRENAFNVSIESNQWDSATGEGVITFNGEVNSIGSYAFYSCRNLKSIRIPENVTTIGTAAFRECFKLKDVYLNSKIKSIGNSAFVGCFDFYNSTYGSINFHMNSIADWCQIDMPTEVVSGQETIYLYVNGSLIKDIDIPSSINAIKPYAFKFCYVKKITMHKDVTSIGKEAFYDSPVDAIYCKSTTPPAGCEDMFKETSLSYIYVPEESVNSYKTAQYWSSYSSKITPYNFE